MSLRVECPRRASWELEVGRPTDSDVLVSGLSCSDTAATDMALVMQIAGTQPGISLHGERTRNDRLQELP